MLPTRLQSGTPDRSEARCRSTTPPQRGDASRMARSSRTIALRGFNGTRSGALYRRAPTATETARRPCTPPARPSSSVDVIQSSMAVQKCRQGDVDRIAAAH